MASDGCSRKNGVKRQFREKIALKGSLVQKKVMQKNASIGNNGHQPTLSGSSRKLWRDKAFLEKILRCSKVFQKVRQRVFERENVLENLECRRVFYLQKFTNIPERCNVLKSSQFIAVIFRLVFSTNFNTESLLTSTKTTQACRSRQSHLINMESPR